MKRRWMRTALVAVAAALISQAPMATPAQADGYCGGGETPFVGATAGTVDAYEYEDWYSTQSLGSTTITLDPDNYYSRLEVYTQYCNSQLCSNSYGYTLTCTVNHSGPLSIRVSTIYYYETSTYTLTAVPGVPNPTVPPQCNDGLDNDLNGRTDYPSDSGCSSYSDNTESSPPAQSCSSVLGVPVCVIVETGSVYQSVTAYGPRTTVTATHTVVGTVDIYSFPLATGGSVTLPCVVLSANTTTNNTCDEAGGTYVSRVATLVNQSVNQPGVAVDVPLATVRVCRAEYTITAAGIGVSDFPAYTLC